MLIKSIININKIIKKIYRSLSKSYFITNNLRIYFLRKAGVNIGDQVTINEGFTLACDIGYESNLTIGDRVALAPNVTIVLTSHPNNSKLRDLKKTYHFIEVFGKTSILHDTWIGAGVIVLPNVIVGEFSVIGAGAVVTKNISPYTVVAGVPARAIRSLPTRELKIE